MRVRRLRKEPAGLEITAFINLVVVLVPFLLSTAVFSRLAVMDMSLPAKSNGAAEQLKVDELKLEVVIRKDAVDVTDRIGGLIERFPAGANGAPDTKALGALMVSLKAKFPQQSDATVLAEASTSYDRLVQVMDAVRAHRVGERTAELFPKISIGDAPLLNPPQQLAKAGAPKR
jgi:biopolymer transport protein ExbD